jgi:hypothetical protein
MSKRNWKCERENIRRRIEMSFELRSSFWRRGIIQRRHCGALGYTPAGREQVAQTIRFTASAQNTRAVLQVSLSKPPRIIVEPFSGLLREAVPIKASFS